MNSKDNDEPAILILGRMHRTRDQRQRIRDEYERSCLSAPKFAALCGVKYQTFANWLQRRKRPRNDPKRTAEAPVQWLEASRLPDAAGAGDGLALQLPGGVRDQITNQGQVKLAAALVRALENPSSFVKDMSPLHALNSLNPSVGELVFA